MSRVGAKPITIPGGVKVAINDGVVEINGPKGKLSTKMPPGIQVQQSGTQLTTQPQGEGDNLSALWGLARSLLANAVKGVSEGFSKELDIVGIGYRAQLEGRDVVFALGYSHPVRFPIPEGVEIKVDKQTHLTVSGADKQLVGQTAAVIRSLRKPDP